MWYMRWRKLKKFSVHLYFLHDKGHRSHQLSVKVMRTFKPFTALLGAFLWRSGYKVNRDCERQIIHISLQNNVVLSILANLWDQCKFFHWSRSLKKKTIVFYLPNTRVSFEYSAFLWGAALLRKRLLVVHTTCCSHAVWTALQSRHKADCSETGPGVHGIAMCWGSPLDLRGSVCNDWEISLHWENLSQGGNLSPVSKEDSQEANTACLPSRFWSFSMAGSLEAHALPQTPQLLSPIFVQGGILAAYPITLRKRIGDSGSDIQS